MTNDKIPGSQRAISDTRPKSITPTETVGKILFFDYHKNRFGFIYKIKTLPSETDKAYVGEKSVACKRALLEEETVISGGGLVGGELRSSLSCFD